MPQLDIITFFSQTVWLFFFGFCYYVIVFYYFVVPFFFILNGRFFLINNLSANSIALDLITNYFFSDTNSEDLFKETYNFDSLLFFETSQAYDLQVATSVLLAFKSKTWDASVDKLLCFSFIHNCFQKEISENASSSFFIDFFLKYVFLPHIFRGLLFF
jgi:hypothetical protein